MIKTPLLLLLIICCMPFISCKKSNNAKTDIVKPITLPQNGQTIITAHNSFALSFLELANHADTTETNKLISPLSIYLALSMVYNGADSTTREAIRATLWLDDFTSGINDLNKTCQALIEQMPEADSKVNLAISNSIWYKQNVSPLQSFLNTNKEYYHASVTPLNFESANAVSTINQWVSDNTKGKITEILKSISPGDLMYLINTIYFKAPWQYAFDKNATANALFTLLNGNTVSTPFMKLNSDKLSYYQDNLLQMVQLPYGQGNFNMYVLLPRANILFSGFVYAINEPTFKSYLSMLKPADVTLNLPRFKYGYAVNDMPKLLWPMRIAFSEEANFTKMYTTPGVHITKALHKTFIEVNEEGTEAAAVTAIGIGLTSSATNYMNCNRPFMYVITEKTSEAILFTGLIKNPSL